MSQPCAGRPLGELRVREERGRVCSGNRGPVGRWGDLQAWSVAQEGWGVPQGLGRVCGSRRHGQIWFSQLAPATGWGTHTGHARAERRARQPRGSGGLAGEQRREGVGAGWGVVPGLRRWPGLQPRQSWGTYVPSWSHLYRPWPCHSAFSPAGSLHQGGLPALGRPGDHHTPP